MEQKLRKLEQRAWVMYDWANSAFATTVMGAILPNYFAAYIATEGALSIWGYTVAIGSLIAALISPVLGAIADFRGSKKKFMVFFIALGRGQYSLAVSGRSTRRSASGVYPVYPGDNWFCRFAGVL